MEENKGVRRNHPPAFRAKVAIEAIKGEKTIAQLSGIYGVHSSLVTKWKAMAIPILEQGFAGRRESVQKDNEELTAELYQQIGRLKVQIDWLKKKRLALSSLEGGLTVRGKVSHIKSCPSYPSPPRPIYWEWPGRACITNRFQ